MARPLPYDYCNDDDEELPATADKLRDRDSVSHLSDLDVGELTEFWAYLGEPAGKAVRRLRDNATGESDRFGASISFERNGDRIIARRLNDGAHGRLSSWTDLKVGEVLIFLPWADCATPQMELAHRIATFLRRAGKGTFVPFVSWDPHICVRRVE